VSDAAFNVAELQESYRKVAGEVFDLRRERDALLHALVESYTKLSAVSLMEDWPADTVLGGNGVDCIRELTAARGSIGAHLANYRENELEVAVARHAQLLVDRMHAARMRLEAKRRGAEAQP
jgi:hypothetical protein